ncbi:homocysteine S-methyltransferase [Nocardioides maradonensis]
MEQTPVVVLDGGLSTALEEQGVRLDGPLWTARLLAEEPDRIRAAHRAYFAAGAQVATTSTYQASVDGFVAAGHDPDTARSLIRLSVELAQQARAELADRPGLLVAASVGPYGAVLADGSEYRGRYGVSHSHLRAFHRSRLEVLAETGPDLLAVETIPDAVEAEVLREILDDLAIPSWFSYSVRGATTCAGQPLADAYAVLAGSDAIIAAGVNCSDQADVLPALEEVARTCRVPGVAYPNRGGTWDSVTKSWSSSVPLDPALVAAWVEAGARYVGGCCGTGPDDVRVLSEQLAGA